MKITLIILALFSYLNLSSQSFEEFKTKQDSLLKDFSQTDGNFEAYKKNVNNAFLNYRDSINKEFSQFLEQRWETYQVMSGIILERKKPINQPVFSSVKIAAQSEIEINTIKITDDHSIANQTKGFLKQNLPKVDQLLVNYDKGVQGINLPFYGNFIDVSCANMDFEFKSSTQAGVLSAWNQLMDKNYLPLIRQLTSYSETFNLNDWGYLLLVRETAMILFEDKNKAHVFAWFILLNTGYTNVKIAYAVDNLYLLIPSKTEIYNTSFFREKNYNLYLIDLVKIGETIVDVKTYTPECTTYSNDFWKGKVEEFSLYQNAPLNFEISSETRSLGFLYGDQYHQFNIDYNKTVNLFYDDFLKCESTVYFSAPLSEYTLRSVNKGLLPLLEGKSDLEKAQILLTFVQKAFPYQLDSKQFGEERWLFPEEMFMYPYSDCEDRASLFAQLIRHFTDLDIVGVEFPNHIATAIAFDQSISGDIIITQKKKYTICDPTYIGAKVGECMPDLKSKSANVIIF